MNENVKALLEKLAQNKELTEKLSASRNPEEAIKMIKEAIPDAFANVSEDEFKAEMKKISDRQKGSNAELNDDDVEDVAGGYDTKPLESAAVAIF